MKLSAAICIIASCFLNTALGVRVEADGPRPELEPKSDKKFFGKDYPDDVRPTLKNHFGHPYPKIQDDSRYDKDYTKDENDDGGYWKTQMEYDRLKNSLHNVGAAYNAALAKVAEQQKEYERAKEAYEAAAAKEKAAQAKEKEADDSHDEAEGKLGKAKKDVSDQVDEVETEVKDLEDCKNQLAKAKAKLKTLLNDKEAAEKKEAERQAAEDEREVEEREAEMKEAEADKKVKEEAGEHDVALKSFKEEQKEAQKAEEDLADAANNLRKYRRADSDGGVYRSGANLVGSTLSVLLATITLAAV